MARRSWENVAVHEERRAKCGGRKAKILRIRISRTSTTDLDGSNPDDSAMKVFAIQPDHRCFSLLPTDPMFFGKVGFFDGFSMSEPWAKLDEDSRTFYVRDPRKTVAGDFHSLALGCLVYNDAVRSSKAGEILEEAGELLPGRIERVGPVHVLNPMVSYPCFDLERSKYRKAGTAVVEVFEYAFLPEEIGEANVFKDQVRKGVSIYTVADRGDPEKEFYYRYQKAGLTGLVFTELWSD